VRSTSLRSGIIHQSAGLTASIPRERQVLNRPGDSEDNSQYGSQYVREDPDSEKQNISQDKSQISSLRVDLNTGDNEILKPQEELNTLKQANGFLSAEVERLLRELDESQLRLKNQAKCGQTASNCLFPKFELYIGESEVSIKARLAERDNIIREHIKEREITITELQRIRQQCTQISRPDPLPHITDAAAMSKLRSIAEDVKDLFQSNLENLPDRFAACNMRQDTEELLARYLFPLSDRDRIKTQVLELEKEVGAHNILRALTAGLLGHKVFQSSLLGPRDSCSELLDIYRVKILAQAGLDSPVYFVSYDKLAYK
jgi:hypothetical protein